MSSMIDVGRPACRIEAVTSAADLEPVADEWRALWERCPDATPFQSPDWVLPWWRHLGRGHPHCVLIRRHGRLAGVLPLYGRTILPGSSVLRIMGTGVSDSLGCLVEPDDARELCGLLMDAARQAAGPAGVLDLQQLPADSLLRDPEAARPGREWGEALQDWCPVLRISEGPERSSSLEKRILASQGRLARLHGGRVERVSGPPGEGMEALFRLHSLRWRGRGFPGAFHRQAVVEFHQDVARRFERLGWLRLYLLLADGAGQAESATHPIAALYAFAAKGRTLYYAGGFDPAYGRFSPGSILLLSAIRSARSEGCREWDFLRGAEPYKLRWGAEPRANWCLVESSRNPLSQATAAAILAGHRAASAVRRAWERRLR